MSIRTKKCPYCSVTIKINDTECFSCHKKVGAINEHGIAEKPINWKANILAVISCSAFIYYVIWLFFLKADK